MLEEETTRYLERINASYTVKDINRLPKTIKFVRDIKEPFGIVKEYHGELIY